MKVSEFFEGFVPTTFSPLPGTVLASVPLTLDSADVAVKTAMILARGHDYFVVVVANDEDGTSRVDSAFQLPAVAGCRHTGAYNVEFMSTPGYMVSLCFSQQRLAKAFAHELSVLAVTRSLFTATPMDTIF